LFLAFNCPQESMECGDRLDSNGVRDVQELDDIERAVAALDASDKGGVLLQHAGEPPLTHSGFRTQFAYQLAQDILLAPSEALPISSSQYWQS
jgi:hypothetical protein